MALPPPPDPAYDTEPPAAYAHLAWPELKELCEQAEWEARMAEEQWYADNRGWFKDY